MQEEIKYIIKDSALGSVLVAQSEKGACTILIANDSLTVLGDMQDHFPKAYVRQGGSQLEKLGSTLLR